MLGLLLKDLINLKKFKKIFVIYILVYGFIAYTQKEASLFTSIFTILLSILTLSSYSYDEIAKWDVYALTMPVTRDDIVCSKYSLMLLLSAMGYVMSTVFTVALNLMFGAEDIFLGVETCYIAAVIIAFFYCIIIPLITKLGVEKARYIFFAAYMIPVGITYLLKQAAEAGVFQIPTQIVEIVKFAIRNRHILIPIVLVVALWISYAITVRIYRKKEF